MENLIIIGIIVIAVGVGIYSSIKHFKGQGGCCGGASYRPRQKKLQQVKFQKVFFVDGMRCAHCKSRIEEVVNDVDGVAGKVDLRSGTVLVSYVTDVADAVLQARIERAGYTVTDIQQANTKKS